MLSQRRNAVAAGTSDLPPVLAPVSRSFSRTIRKYGPRAKGVGWSNADWQLRRFQIFAGLFAYEKTGLTINDLGCGYGAMFEAYRDLPQLLGGRYVGYDISPHMLDEARKRISDPRAEFILSHEATEEADYSFVSGSYNICMEANEREWLGYVFGNLEQLWSKTRTGLAFNMLDRGTPEKAKTLYYADRRVFLDFCQKALSPKARLFDGYSDTEWTIFVRR